MIVDTSALMAILLREPERQVMVDALTSATSRRMSAGTWIELGAVATRRKFATMSASSLDAIMRDLAITVEPVTAEQVSIGHDAYRRYGIGSGHPARLNFGDCFAYALARATGEPLLFKGDDFAATDIASALSAG